MRCSHAPFSSRLVHVADDVYIVLLNPSPSYHLRIIIVVRETRRQASVVRLSDSLLVASGQVSDSPYAFAHSTCIRPADAYVRSFIMCIYLRGTIGRRAPRSLVV